MSPDLTIVTICSLVAIGGGLLGPFLILRRLSLMSDAISHSVVLGIALGFLIFKSTDSVPMLLAASLTGVLTVWLTETLLRTRLVKEDASIGLVFPALFSLGVILITRLLSDIHIDVDAALVGEVALAPFDTITLGTVDVARSLVTMGAVVFADLLFVSVLYKELKLATFDGALAAALGFSPMVLGYSLMGLVSVTAVGSFDAVGAVLFVGFVVVPASISYLLTDSLARMIGLSALIGVAATILGFEIARLLDASISGCIVMVLGGMFILTLVFAPRRGLLAGWLRRRRQRWEFAVILLTVHLLNHENQPNEAEESALQTLPEHLHWERGFAQTIIRRAIHQRWIQSADAHLKLTALGRRAAKEALPSRAF